MPERHSRAPSPLPALQLETRNRFEYCDTPEPESGPGGGTIQALEFIYPQHQDFDDGELDNNREFRANWENINIYAEAMRRPDAQKWHEAAENEIKALVENGTWELVSRPPNSKPIGSKWVFKVKRHADGSIDRYKGRVVAKGYNQCPGIDFDEVFAPAARWSALRAILAQGAFEGAYIESIDISNAYLNGELEPGVELFMKQPEGFHRGGDDFICRLMKGLYGLRQGGRLWSDRLARELEAAGRVVIPVYVDDITLISTSRTELDRIKKHVTKAFKLKDLGSTTFLLNVST